MLLTLREGPGPLCCVVHQKSPQASPNAVDHEGGPWETELLLFAPAKPLIMAACCLSAACPLEIPALQGCTWG